MDKYNFMDIKGHFEHLCTGMYCSDLEKVKWLIAETERLREILRLEPEKEKKICGTYWVRNEGYCCFQHRKEVDSTNEACLCMISCWKKKQSKIELPDQLSMELTSFRQVVNVINKIIEHLEAREQETSNG